MNIILDWGRLATAYIRHKVLDRKVNEYIKELDYTPIEKLPLNNFKKSNKLFILGSGGSLNQLTSEDWKHIEKHDSFGFNFSIVHEHIPTYFMFEYIADDERKKVFNKLIEKKAEQYKNVPLICQVQHYVLHDCTPLSFEGFKMYYVNSVLLRLRSRLALQIYLRVKKATLNSQFMQSLPIHYRGSLSLAIWLAINWGYKEIVLLGVDLSNSKYFWQDNNQYDLYPPKSRGVSKPHKTGIKMSGIPPIDDYIMLFKQTILNPLGTKIYIGSSSSKLYPRLPLYKLL